ncbi:MAG: AAA family ATPase, partial [Sciscionella sp.]
GAHELWQRWEATLAVTEPAAVADALDAVFAELAPVVAETIRAAEDELARRNETWQPLARRLATWHDDAEKVRAADDTRLALKQAEQWLKGAAADLRNERLAPFAEHSARIWRRLRQQSSVELGPVQLAGNTTQRHVALDVTVDGVAGTALGVMSQGELHALALALFLPRATAEESPFRFLLIDDPVQAMDPAKVDGLARVLAEVATSRQVVVLTHDDRLAEAVRRLRLEATIWEVCRGERSTVELRRSDNPVSRYLGDAWALASSPKLPVELRGELVASCCRGALEAAAQAKVRAVRLGRGESHNEVEAALRAARTTHNKLTLAEFDDPGRGKELYPRLNRLGHWAVDTVRECKEGAHIGGNADLRALITNTGKLAERLLP